MSTKCTISYNDNYHLYRECFDDHTIWLQLDDIDEISVSVERLTSSWRSNRTTIGIPIELWNEIVDGWLSSRLYNSKPLSEEEKVETEKNHEESIDRFLKSMIDKVQEENKSESDEK